MASATARAIAVGATGLLAACGGGPDEISSPVGIVTSGENDDGGRGSTGGGSGEGEMDGSRGEESMDGSPVGAAVVAGRSVAGLYRADGDLKLTMLITPDDRALIRIEAPTARSNVPEAFAILDSELVPATEDVRTRIIQSALSLGPLVAVNYTTADPGALVKGFSDGVEYRLKPFSSSTTHFGFGGFDVPSNPAVKPLMVLPIAEKLSLLLDSFPSEYNTPSSLERISNTYTRGTFSLTVDSAGQVSGLDSSTNCAITGKVNVDMPLVNAYSLELTVSMCADVPQNVIQNGTYTGRASVLDSPDNTRSILFFAHSSTIALNIPVLTTATLPPT